MKMPLLTACKLALVLLSCSIYPALGDDLDVDLSKPDVRLDVSFKGSDILLFGAKDIKGDVIVVVRGPNKDTSVRFKQRIAGIWMNTDEVVYTNVPSFYALASTAPVFELLPTAVLKSERIGTENLGLEKKSSSERMTAETLQDFTKGLIRNMESKKLYTPGVGSIKIVGKQLFKTELWFPSNVNVGNYSVDTYLIKNGRIETKKTTHLQVHKFGIEAQIYNFAHEHALIYGFLAVIIAMVSGWLANAVIFMRKG